MLLFLVALAAALLSSCSAWDTWCECIGSGGSSSCGEYVPSAQAKRFCTSGSKMAWRESLGIPKANVCEWEDGKCVTSPLDVGDECESFDHSEHSGWRGTCGIRACQTHCCASVFDEHSLVSELLRVNIHVAGEEGAHENLGVGPCTQCGENGQCTQCAPGFLLKEGRPPWVGRMMNQLRLYDNLRAFFSKEDDDYYDDRDSGQSPGIPLLDERFPDHNDDDVLNIKVSCPRASTYSLYSSDWDVVEFNGTPFQVYGDMRYDELLDMVGEICGNGNGDEMAINSIQSRGKLLDYGDWRMDDETPQPENEYEYEYEYEYYEPHADGEDDEDRDPNAHYTLYYECETCLFYCDESCSGQPDAARCFRECERHCEEGSCGGQPSGLNYYDHYYDNFMCFDQPGWRNIFGEGCFAFEREEHCEYFGADRSVVKPQRLATRACCACGGGSFARFELVPMPDTPWQTLRHAGFVDGGMYMATLPQFEDDYTHNDNYVSSTHAPSQSPTNADVTYTEAKALLNPSCAELGDPTASCFSFCADEACSTIKSGSFDLDGLSKDGSWRFKRTTKWSKTTAYQRIARGTDVDGSGASGFTLLAWSSKDKTKRKTHYLADGDYTWRVYGSGSAVDYHMREIVHRNRRRRDLFGRKVRTWETFNDAVNELWRLERDFRWPSSAHNDDEGVGFARAIRDEGSASIETLLDLMMELAHEDVWDTASRVPSIRALAHMDAVARCNLHGLTRGYVFNLVLADELNEYGSTHDEECGRYVDDFRPERYCGEYTRWDQRTRRCEVHLELLTQDSNFMQHPLYCSAEQMLEQSTASPSFPRSATPVMIPIEEPTTAPSPPPTSYPTRSPTKLPTSFPTALPTSRPSASPTTSPSASPTTKYPTSFPSEAPTQFPTTRSPTSPTAVQCSTIKVQRVRSKNPAAFHHGIQAGKFVYHCGTVFCAPTKAHKTARCIDHTSAPTPTPVAPTQPSQQYLLCGHVMDSSTSKQRKKNACKKLERCTFTDGWCRLKATGEPTPAPPPTTAATCSDLTSKRMCTKVQPYKNLCRWKRGKCGPR